MTHNTTVLAQLLNLIDRQDFQKFEDREFKPQRQYRTFSHWSSLRDDEVFPNHYLVAFCFLWWLV